MHEMSVVTSIVDAICEHAESIGASRVCAVRLAIGEMRDIHEPLLQRYFDFFSRETIAEGVDVEVEHVPVMLRCGECGGLYRYDHVRDLVFPAAAGPGAPAREIPIGESLVSGAGPRCPEHPDAGAGLAGGTELSIESIGVI